MIFRIGFLIIFTQLFTNYSIARSTTEKIRLMKKNASAQCSFEIDYLLQTQDGYSTPDKAPEKVVFLDKANPIPSGPSDFAIYSLSWHDEDYSFYYYMNSQVGEIRIKDKRMGISAETDLDLSDMEKKEFRIGEARLVVKEDVIVTHPVTNEQVPGEKHTYLKGVCRKKLN